ncbi:MAG: class I SAM-dependent methyltransferase [Thiotrichaceae bacterium]
MHIAISSDDETQTEALQLSQKTEIPLHDPTQQPASFLLHLTPSHLELKVTKDPSLKPLYIDFLNGKNNHRRLYGGGKGQQLAKAIGLNKYKNPTVLDTTAGLGRDAFVLATLGCKVTLLERTLPVYLLLANALERALQSNDQTVKKIIHNMSLHHMDSLGYLSELEVGHYPDVIYIDPMFPPREKSAKVKKEMAMFHHLVGKDIDAEELIEAALPCALKRIVVKRPKLAECLYPKPAFQLIGKSTRYDVYLPSPPSS